MPTWVRFNDTSERWEYSINAGAAWNELPLGIRLTDGAEGAPSLAFEQDSSTGLWSPGGSGSNRLQFSTAGAGRWEIDDDGHFVPVDNLTYDIGNSGAIIREIAVRSHRGVCLAAFAFSAGQGNDAGGADTVLDAYDVTIPADLMAQPGDCLIVESAYYNAAANANAKTGKLQIDATGLKTLFTTAAVLASQVIDTRHLIRRRTSTTGSLIGAAWTNQSAASPTTGVRYFQNAGLAGIDWTASQTLHFYAAATVANNLKLTDLNVFFYPVITGVTV